MTTTAPGDRAMRPQTLDAFVGQDHFKGNLRTFIDASKARQDALDHVLLLGPPGLGKTTLSNIIAAELGRGFKMTNAPVVTKPEDLAAALIDLDPLDVFFIDEIHALPLAVCEMIYTAMEDYYIDLIIGDGADARPVRIELAPFTLIGATTHPGSLPDPMRARFGIPLRLQPYSDRELVEVLAGMGAKMGMELDPAAQALVAARSRGTPRVAGRLLRRLRDFAPSGAVNAAQALDALERLQIDALGLEAQDRAYIQVLIDTFGGGPVGLDTLAAALAEGRSALENMIEPYLMQQGLIMRGPRGRLVTARGYQHLGYAPPAASVAA